MSALVITKSLGSRLRAICCRHWVGK